MASGNYKIDMSEGPIFSRLCSVALPLIATNMLQYAFNAADVAVVGKFAGDNALAAVGATSFIIYTVTTLFIGISSGANIVAARFFGAKDEEHLERAVHTAVALSFISGVLLTAIGMIFARVFLELSNCPSAVIDQSVLYFRLYFTGMIPFMIYTFCAAILRAFGDTKRPFRFLFISGIVNLVLNIIFVVGFKLDVAGVAIATVLSQILSAILVFRTLLHENGSARLYIGKIRIDRKIALDIIKIGIPAGVQSSLQHISNVVVQASVNSFGEFATAASSASNSVEQLVVASTMGFGHAHMSFVSQNYGAKRYDRIWKGLWTAMITSAALAAAIGILEVVFSDPLMHIFTDGEQTIVYAKQKLFYVCGFMFLQAIIQVCAASLRGIGYNMYPMLCSLIIACGIRVLWLVTVFRIPQYHQFSVIFIIYPISWALTALVEMLLFLRFFKIVKHQA